LANEAVAGYLIVRNLSNLYSRPK
jgi:hypothetical protein